MKNNFKLISCVFIASIICSPSSFAEEFRVPFSNADIVACKHEVTPDKVHSYSYVVLETLTPTPMGKLKHSGISMEKHGMASDPNVCVLLNKLIEDAQSNGGFIKIDASIKACNWIGVSETGRPTSAYYEWLVVRFANDLEFIDSEQAPGIESSVPTCQF